MSLNIITSKNLQTGFENMLLTLKKHHLTEHNIIVVPDKFSLNAEQLLLEVLNINVSFNIEVLSFTKLANIVLERQLKTKKIINKQISMLILSDVIEANKDNLNYFKNVNLIDGFCEDIYNLISQIQTSDFSMDNFKQFDEIEKFKDIKLIYEKYLEALKDERVDASKKFEFFIEEASKSEFIKNSNFFFGMFYSLTPQMLKMVKTIIRQSKTTYFACINNNTSLNRKLYFNDLFESLEKISKSLNKELKIENVKENLKPEFAHLESRCFLPVKARYNLNDDSIKLVECENIEGEIRNCLAEIKYDIISKNLQYNDIAICCANLEQYSSLLKKQLKNFEFTAFIDEEQKLENLSFIKFILNLSNIVEDETISNILVALKSEFVQISEKTKNAFEDFILKYNLDEKTIYSNFSNFSKDEDYEEYLSVYNEFLVPLKNYISLQKKCEVSHEYFKNIRDFLTLMNVEETIDVMVKKFEKLDLLKSKQYSQLIDKVEEIFTNLETYLENNFTLKRANYFLKMLFSTNAVLTPPICVDSIFVGDLYNSYFRKYKVIYFLGCTNLNMPKTNIDSSLILEEENENFKLNLEPKIQDVNRLNKFKCFTTLFNACEKIYLSYPKISGNGINFKSSFIVEIQKLFSKHNEPLLINKPDIENLQYLQDNQIVDLIGLTCCNIKDIETEYLKSDGHYKTTLLEILKHLNYSDDESSFIDLENLKIEKLSVSKLEDYFNCPRKFMLKHIANLRQKDSLKLELKTIGNIMHECIKYFSESLNKIKEDEVTRTAIKIFDKVLKEEKYLYLTYQSENLILIETLKNEFVKFCNNYFLQQKNSDYKNALNEFCFNGKIGSYDFKGIADRIDVFENNFIVVDYKTGSTKFNYSDVYTGKKIQLCLYALFLEKVLDKKCSGIFYLNLNDNFKKDLSSQNLMQGLIVNENNNLYKLDNSMTSNKGNFKSEFFDFSKKLLINSKELDNLKTYCFDKAKDAISDIESQKFDESPLKTTGQMSEICDYCEFNTICLNKKFRYSNSKTNEIEMIGIMKDEKN